MIALFSKTKALEAQTGELCDKVSQDSLALERGSPARCRPASQASFCSE
jgi:hypothetical protein